MLARFAIANGIQRGQEIGSFNKMAIGWQAGPRKRRNASAPDTDHNAALPALEDVGEFALLSMIGSSPTFNETVRRMGRIAMRDASVLIEGETGSGKEVAARAIHYLGARRGRPFIPVNCGAVPDSLIEAEFFGHGRGAFTDAREARAGLIAQAHGGTLFLDEIDSLTPKAQVALLRFLQDQKYKPVGRDVELEADVRIIAATNKSLIALANSDRFRTDLLHRLRILYLYIPPLRERVEDISVLARHFAQKFAMRMKKRIETIPVEAMKTMQAYPWPGNVRELGNFIERAVILSTGSDLVVPLSELKSPTTPSHDSVVTLEEAERKHILQVLRDSRWTLGGPGGAAARLGMKRTTLHSKMRKLGIVRPS